jgi:hypothetical protein
MILPPIILPELNLFVSSLDGVVIPDLGSVWNLLGQSW